MKKNIGFLIVYFVCFVLLTIGAVNFFGGSEHMEMLSGVMWGNLLYVIFGGLSWSLIDIFLSPIFEKNIVVFKFLSGFIILNVLVTIASGTIPFFSLITVDNEFRGSALILSAYAISFIVASLVFLKRKEVKNDLSS